MYKITQKTENGLQYLEIANSDNASKALFCLNQGGRVSQIVLKEHAILADYSPSSYQSDYASAILFPFANRIKNGTYTHEGYEHFLFCNETEKNNALHGLVHNKPFQLIEEDLTSAYGSFTLHYSYEGQDEGFPFPFTIALSYRISESEFSLKVTVHNPADTSFPFTVGWHPYFATANLNDSTIVFESELKYVCDEQQAVAGTVPCDLQMPFRFENIHFDDGFSLKTDAVRFLTPQYGVTLKSSAPENYLQLYTPPTPNVIAIEPMTGVADSFNNKIGLQRLEPKNTFTVAWTLTFDATNYLPETNQKTNSLCNF